MSEHFDLNEFEECNTMLNTTNNTHIEEQISSQDITVPLELAEPTDISGLNICTNLRFDYEKLKWTDNEFAEDRNFMLKWNRRFGGFWVNRENMFPTQPYQPGTNWKKVENSTNSQNRTLWSITPSTIFIKKISAWKSERHGWLQKKT